MDNSQSPVITAIADVAQESLIASFLAKLGFQIIYRATSAGLLSPVLQANPTALLVASDDFRDLAELHAADLLVIRGKSTMNSSRSLLNPKSEAEFLEILQDRNRIPVSGFLRPGRCASKLSLFFTTGNARGATISAINVAQELANQGERVLLVDADFGHPDLCARFELNGLFKKAQLTQFGFALCEINSLESLQIFAQAANAFEHVIIDFGHFDERYLHSSGRRYQDFTYAWAVQSASKVFILTNERSLSNLSRMRQLISTNNSEIDYSLVITLESAIGSREREKISSRITQKSGLPAYLLSRDFKSVARMESESSTILLASPKSMLKGEFSALASHVIRG